MAGHDITAELAGTVLSVECSAGGSVAAEDTLLVIESMKMEIPVTAPFAGRVEAIAVAAGDVVQEGQVLVRLEEQGT